MLRARGSTSKVRNRDPPLPNEKRGTLCGSMVLTFFSFDLLLLITVKFESKQANNCIPSRLFFRVSSLVWWLASQPSPIHTERTTPPSGDGKLSSSANAQKGAQHLLRRRFAATAACGMRRDLAITEHRDVTGFTDRMQSLVFT